MPRYAIFYAPLQKDPLNKAAAHWLGRDVFSGESLERPSMVEGIEREEFDALTASARRYGFHGTLKAPFELAEGHIVEDLEEALESYCKSLTPFMLPTFEVGQLGAFFALRPSEPSEALKQLASNLVRDFDSFRAPLSEADIARRNPERLTERQRENLLTWAYPYIFDDFRFHMTLTNPIPDHLTEPFKLALQRYFEPCLSQAREVSALSLYQEEERGAPFLVRAQFPIG
ncbi:DUF1045 domain-containing protein [uncultured Cohaesibacter sp.]|uniref:DUF1045 domain-containing protein n=1 Tax=uncultured Cohaesibacter sp. TaxID=1002546 RepID=UPI002931E7B9|nr:DUF1045 domain-containing protein [uncultured Cohaesibacter sp.]